MAKCKATFSNYSELTDTAFLAWTLETRYFRHLQVSWHLLVYRIQQRSSPITGRLITYKLYFRKSIYVITNLNLLNLSLFRETELG